MNLTDPVADLLTRIRNAGMARHAEVVAPNSRLKEGILQVLKDEGYIRDYATVPGVGAGSVRITLRYERNKHVISGVRRESKPGQRRYVACGEIPKVLSGYGIAILTTSQGVMTGREAKEKGIGGELLCTVW